MAKYEHLPIYRRSFDLAVYLEKSVRNFSRFHKYGLGLRLQHAAQDVLARVIRVQNTVSSDRVKELEELRVELEVLKNLLHLAKEVRAFKSFKTVEVTTGLFQDGNFPRSQSMVPTPKGFRLKAQGCARVSGATLGQRHSFLNNPERGCVTSERHNPFRVADVCGRQSQGSARGATLGFRTKPPWGSRRAGFHVRYLDRFIHKAIGLGRSVTIVQESSDFIIGLRERRVSARILLASPSRHEEQT